MQAIFFFFFFVEFAWKGCCSPLPISPQFMRSSKWLCPPARPGPVAAALTQQTDVKFSCSFTVSCPSTPLSFLCYPLNLLQSRGAEFLPLLPWSQLLLTESRLIQLLIFRTVLLPAHILHYKLLLGVCSATLKRYPKKAQKRWCCKELFAEICPQQEAPFLSTLAKLYCIE